MGRRPSSLFRSGTPRHKTGFGRAHIDNQTADLVINEDQLIRIEQLVFQKLGRSNPQNEPTSLEPATADLISDSDLAAMVYGPDVADQELEDPSFRGRRSSRIIAIAGLIVALLAASLVRLPGSWMMGRSFPLKHQIESVRLALSFGDVAKADNLISIASDRLAYIMKEGRDIEDILVAGVQMTSMASAALDLLYRMPTEPSRDAAAGRLFGLMASAGSHLETIEAKADSELKPHVRALITSAEMIALQAQVILSFADLGFHSPEAFRRFALPNQQRNVRESTRRRAPQLTSSHEFETDDQGSSAENPPPGEEGPNEPGCDLSEGSICITFPPLPTI